MEGLEERLVPATIPPPQVFNPGNALALINDLQAASNTPNVPTIINLQSNVDYQLKDINNYWYGPTGLPPIDSDVTIHGNGATIERDPNTTALFRLFYVSGGMELPAGKLTMDNVTLDNGFAKGGDSSEGGGGLGAGGAIFNQGTLNLTGVTLVNNEALGGSGDIGYGGGGIGGGGGGMGQDGGHFLVIPRMELKRGVLEAASAASSTKPAMAEVARLMEAAAAAVVVL